MIIFAYKHSFNKTVICQHSFLIFLNGKNSDSFDKADNRLHTAEIWMLHSFCSGLVSWKLFHKLSNPRKPVCTPCYQHTHQQVQTRIFWTEEHTDFYPSPEALNNTVSLSPERKKATGNRNDVLGFFRAVNHKYLPNATEALKEHMLVW